MNNSNFIVVPQNTTVPSFTNTGSYASKWNQQYNDEDSFYVDLKERLEQTIQSLPYTVQQSIRAAIKNACGTFEKLNPVFKKFEDIELCEAVWRPLSDILIDITMQRKLDIAWVLNILKNFRLKGVPIPAIGAVPFDYLGNYTGLNYNYTGLSLSPYYIPLITKAKAVELPEKGEYVDIKKQIAIVDFEISTWAGHS